MAESSAIEWTDSTFNPWVGCTKVSPGCDRCYAEARMDSRLHVVSWGPNMARKRTSAANWREPVKWNARHAEFVAQHGRRQRVFCASLADVFDNEVPAAWREDLLELIARTPNLDWLLLTKRIGNVKRMLDEVDAQLPSNVWLGATIVNQAEADRDIPKLLETPARVRFLSMEPLLGPVDLVPYLHDIHLPMNQALHWVIAGGESGHGARPMHPDWTRTLRDQCAAAGVPFLFKQWGEWAHDDQPGVNMLGTERSALHKWGDLDYSVRLGKKAAGRLLDGVEHNGFPKSVAA